MTAVLVVCLLAVVLTRWVYVRERFAEMEARLEALASLVGRQGMSPATAPAPTAEPAAPRDAAIRTVRPPVPPPSPEPPRPAPVIPPVTAPDPPAPVAARETPLPEPVRRDWESLVGGNFLNKLGMFVLVIGMALALGYSFTRLGPGGRVAISICASLAMLAGGVSLEGRDEYRTFARGLIGGGWAALYFTVYAMHSVEAARVIGSPWLAAVLLMLVAAGMIGHSLRYRSETVTGLAYFIAFVTLAITQVTAFSVIALVPLAASLLFVAHRFAWRHFAVFGLLATYVTCASRGDSGASLWQAQSIFAVYWLLFETFDILRPHRALLPLNALGFLSLSYLKWSHAMPSHLWMAAAGSATAYLVSTLVRARSSRWRGAVTVTALLYAVAILLRLDAQWVVLALAVEAELLYLTGVRFDEPYLRQLAAVVFAFETGHLVLLDIRALPVRAWTPIAVFQAIAFYANRALSPAGVPYSYAGAAMLALVAGYEVPAPRLGTSWFALAAFAFCFGWWRRLRDFRFQAYGLAALGALATAWHSPHPPLSLAAGAVCAFAGALCALRSAPDRFGPAEREAVRRVSSLATTVMLAALAWRLAPVDYLGLGWMALAVPLLLLGLCRLPADFKRQAYVLAFAGAAVVLAGRALPIQNSGPLEPRLIAIAAGAIAYLIAFLGRDEEGGRVLEIASFAGTGFLLTGLWAVLPPAAVAPAWAAVALVLAEFGVPALGRQAYLASVAAFARLFFANFDIDQRLLTVVPVLLSHYYLWWRTRQRFYLYTAAVMATVLMRFEMGRVFTVTGWSLLSLALLWAGLRWSLDDLKFQSCALAAAAFVRCWATNFYSPEMFAGIAGPVLTGTITVAALYASQMLLPRDTRIRLYYSLLASSLFAGLLFYEVSGSLLTVAWGIEGLALLIAGFPLRDRFQRLSGMALLLFCILKLFVWDLRHLDTLPRILSFLVLGLILVGVSWIYTRFRERVERYL